MNIPLVEPARHRPRIRRAASLVGGALLAAALCHHAGAQCQTYTVANGPATYIAGTTDIGNHGDEVITSVSMPFAISLYGVSYTSVNVSSNGFLEFGDTVQSYLAGCMPNTTFAAPTIFARWDDLDTSGGGVLTNLSGSAGSRTFVIEWHNTTSYDSGASNLNFEVVFYENQTYFDIVYQNTDSGTQSIVGVQSLAHNAYTKFSCKSANLSNGLSLRFSCGTSMIGACCSPTGTCFVTPQSSCADTFMLGGACTPNPCGNSNAAACGAATDLNALMEPYTTPYHTQVDASSAPSAFLSIPSFNDLPGEYRNVVWYTFTAPATGYLYYSDVHQKYANHDTPSIYYPGTLFAVVTDCQATAAVEHHDFEPQTSFPGAQPHYGFLEAGETIKILVASGLNAPYPTEPAGTLYDLTFNFVPSTVPANDLCENAVNLTTSQLPLRTEIDTLLATDDESNCSTIFQGAWFTYTPSWTGKMRVREVGRLDAMRATGSSCSSLPTCWPEDVPGHVELVDIVAGQPIKFLVGTTTPIFESPELLQVEFSLVPNSCSNPLPVPVPGSVGGVVETGENRVFPALCNNFDSGYGRVLWYSVLISTAGEYTFEITRYNSEAYLIDGYGESFGIGLFTDCPNDNNVATVRLECADQPPHGPRIQRFLMPGTYIVGVSEGNSRGMFRLSVAPTPCAADFNHVNGVTVQDIFDFLTAWLAGNSSADFNHVNGVTVQDIFDFLTAWLAGC